MTKMKECVWMTQPLHKVPSSVQETIPVYAISKEGIFQLEDKPDDVQKIYDRAYVFCDTNFEPMDDREKEDFLGLYCQMLISLSIPFKIVILNNRIDMDRMMDQVQMTSDDKLYEKIVADYNRYYREQLLMGNAGLEQTRLFILSVKAKSLDAAKSYFHSIEANLMANFDQMKSALVPLNAAQRLKYLNDYYHLGEARKFSFNMENAYRRNADWKDLVSPHMVREYKDGYGAFDYKTLQVEEQFVRVMFLPDMPSGINPECIGRILTGKFPCAITVDIQPVPQALANKTITKLYMQIGRNIEKQQELRTRAGQFSSEVSYELRRQRTEVEGVMDAINDDSEKFFYTGVYVVISGTSKKDLENNVNAFMNIADGEGFAFKPAMCEQIGSFHTASPVGVRFSSHMQAILTQPLAGFQPFRVHELRQDNGIVYGINRISKNIIIGDRMTLQNGHGLVTGASGSGKSMGVKTMIGQIRIRRPMDMIIIIDPTNEYRVLAVYYNGSFIDMAFDARYHINPLGIESYREGQDKASFLKDKTMLMLVIFAQIRESHIGPEDNSLIGRAIQKIYEGIESRNFKEPTFPDLYRVLKEQPEERAHELALCLELFVTGAMNMFSAPTNVDLRNNLTVFGMEGMDRTQNGIYIIIMLESIRSLISQNKKKGIFTWIFIDEMHNLANNEYSAGYLEKIWREVRKMGARCTGITQNIGDLLANKAMASMLCNSDFLMMFNHKEAERELIQNELGISPNMLKFITNPPCGCGLMKFGEKLIPFDGRLPADSEMYQLFNTNFAELQNASHNRLIRKLQEEIKKQGNLTARQIMMDPAEDEKSFLPSDMKGSE